MNELWKKWVPISGLAPKYDLRLLSHDLEGFSITLTERNASHNQLLLAFGKTIDDYRKTPLADSYDLLKSLTDTHGRSFYESWTFFTIEHSTFLGWSYTESLETMPLQWFKPLGIITSEAVIEILATKEPKFIVKNE